MKKYSDNKIKEFIKSIWDVDISIISYYDKKNNQGDLIRIRIFKMYNYVDLQFSHLMKIAKFFETLNINEDRTSCNGCDTCDYGSSYEINLSIRPDNNNEYEEAFDVK